MNQIGLFKGIADYFGIQLAEVESQAHVALTADFDRRLAQATSKLPALAKIAAAKAELAKGENLAGDAARAAQAVSADIVGGHEAAERVSSLGRLLAKLRISLAAARSNARVEVEAAVGAVLTEMYAEHDTAARAGASKIAETLSQSLPALLKVHLSGLQIQNLQVLQHNGQLPAVEKLLA